MDLRNLNKPRPAAKAPSLFWDTVAVIGAMFLIATMVAGCADLWINGLPY